MKPLHATCRDFDLDFYLKKKVYPEKKTIGKVGTRLWTDYTSDFVPSF